MNNELNYITTTLDIIIKHRLNDNIISEAEAKILRNILILIQTDTELLNAITSFNVSFSSLDFSLHTGTSIPNDTTITEKLAHLLISILTSEYK